MCGLFGVALPLDLAPSAQVAEMVADLGVLAQERGRDAAGVAALSTVGWRVRKHLGAFEDMDDLDLNDLLGTAHAVIGHTRWATQGLPDLHNAGPIISGQTIGAHNGDLDADSISTTAHIQAGGASDSRLLFAELDRIMSLSDSVIDDVTDLLGSVRGRAALSWTRRTASRTVWLGRAGLSPLAVGRDGVGRLWWASNPGWLRSLDQAFDVGMRVRLLPEGTLWQIQMRNGSVWLRPRGEFIPMVRPFDLRIAPRVVWRGFSAADRRRDAALLRHCVSVGDDGSRGVTNVPDRWPISSGREAG